MLPGTYFKQDQAETISITVVIRNDAPGSGNDIKAVTGSNYNFHLTLQFSDSNMRTTLDSIGDTQVKLL